ncbi:hypothetical protein C500_05503 [Natrialba magadii ATCC 43099]|uniref:Uncharacterized protein n=1 Tax=Natrialba magadii (strain ATCC 43099 / DSM 3394 / CCM 3739 / CIP 104546 / IAM 13178 / JCM 8861 / NBRC 102185 / NCIMB 2190 / MS3) TaxID=547559 RepID=L9V6R0_NATMM|nr:hypothetical protein C500_05503 [Natrialba magadii ATCC 43099]
MSTLPPWIENRIEHSLDKKLTQRHVVEIMLNAERPYFSAEQIRARVRPDRDTSAYPRLPVSDECSDALSEPRNEQAGVCARISITGLNGRPSAAVHAVTSERLIRNTSSVPVMGRDCEYESDGSRAPNTGTTTDRLSPLNSARRLCAVAENSQQ